MTDPLPTLQSIPPGTPPLDMARLGLAGIIILIGALLPLQAGMNAVVRSESGHALYAGVVNFVIGLAALFVLILIMRPGPVQWSALASAPWWTWLAGLIGASIVVFSAIAAPKLGASFMVACLIAGQLIASVVIDQFGLARYPVRPISLERILGILLLIAGLVLVERSTRAGIIPPAGTP